MKRFEGKQTQERVEKLMQACEALKAGDVLMHNEIASVAGVTYDSGAYRATITAFRKKLLRERNIDLEAVHGVGYRCLSENERVGAGVKDFSHSVRKMGRAVDRVERADSKQLDEQHLKQQDHTSRLARALVDSGRSAAKQIAVAGRVVTLPRKVAA